MADRISKKGKALNVSLLSQLPWPLELLCFLLSLGLTMTAAAWFTRRLEALCDRFELSAGVLSILGALGANIPNYAASIAAIARGSTEVGLGIIVGSNIYNIAIILGLATLSTGRRGGLRISPEESKQVQHIGGSTLAILLATLLVVWLLPQHVAWSWSLFSAWSTFSLTRVSGWLLSGGIVLQLGLFGALSWHILRRPHPAHTSKREPGGQNTRRLSTARLLAEAILALVIALAGVVVMVQSGQDLSAQIHLAPALAGLLVLAIATSLPNTVVALMLVRTGRTAACIEEIFSSNSVNAALGIALPLLFWRQDLHDKLLLVLDVPLMVLLSLWAWLCVRRGAASSWMGVLWLLCYLAWVIAHLAW